MTAVFSWISLNICGYVAILHSCQSNKASTERNMQVLGFFPLCGSVSRATQVLRWCRPDLFCWVWSNRRNQVRWNDSVTVVMLTEVLESGAQRLSWSGNSERLRWCPLARPGWRLSTRWNQGNSKSERLSVCSKIERSPWQTLFRTLLSWKYPR